MRYTRTILGATAATVVLTMTVVSLGCGGGERAGEGPQLLLRSFEVDPDLAGELASVLNSALVRGEGEAPVGRAQVGPGGRLIVAAPEKVLAEVAEMIDDVERTAPPPPPLVTITYWAVVGEPAPATEWPDRLDELATALESVAEAEGPTRFTLGEKLRLRSLSGERAHVQGVDFQVTQRASARDGGILADVDLVPGRSGAGRLETRVKLAPDQVLVLGQTGLPRVPRTGQPPEGSIYLVVRAEVETSQ